MGIKLFSSSKYDNPVYYIQKSNNPDPSNFKILWSKQIGEFCILHVNYPDSTNYEGTKILVYRADLREILKQKTLDPHFSESEQFLSPIARFVPTQEGSELSQRFCEAMVAFV